MQKEYHELLQSYSILLVLKIERYDTIWSEKNNKLSEKMKIYKKWIDSKKDLLSYEKK